MMREREELERMTQSAQGARESNYVEKSKETVDVKSEVFVSFYDREYYCIKKNPLAIVNVV